MTTATVDAEFHCPDCGRAVTVATADDYLVWVHTKLVRRSEGDSTP